MMSKRVSRKIADFFQWVYDKVLTSEQRGRIKKFLSENQKQFLKSKFKNGKKQIQLDKIDRVKYRLTSLGFNGKAYDDLKMMYKNSEDDNMRKLAGWELALWHANQYTSDDAEQCIKYLEGTFKNEKEFGNIKKNAILQAECLDLLGKIEEAKKVILKALQIKDDPDLFLSYANLEPELQTKIEYINKALSIKKLSNISISDSGKTMYDRLKGRKGEDPRKLIKNVIPKVTVIIPVYNAEEGLTTALDSVLSQTWTNLEIIVVDDCSTDSTVTIVNEYIKKDSRVLLIKTETNSGPYIARNLALKKSTGTYVTINDADDWSHPQKIERQVTHLEGNPKVIGNTSQQSRATNELKFFRRGKPGHFIFSNMSSFMFRREPVLEKIGYWDSVRFGADSEFIKRVKLVFGDKSVIELTTGPLSFQRQTNTSLTGSSAFGFPGYFMGARKEYTEAQTYYHSNTENYYYNFPQKQRPFPIPEPMLPSRESTNDEKRKFDVIIVSDFRLDGGSTISNLEEIKAQKEMGFRTGLIQLARYDYSPKKFINSKIRDTIDGVNVQMLVYGEQVACRLLIIRYPPVLEEWQRFVPSVEAEFACVIVNQTPMSDYGDTGIKRFDIIKCNRHLQEYFGVSGTWYPIGPLVRKTLYKHHKKEIEEISLGNDDWNNIINIKEWRRESYEPNKEKIKIGRHSRDHVVKWPENKDELLEIYPVNDNFEVHVLGGGEIPRGILGKLPENWRVYNFDEKEPKEFLATLDVFVYYTHSDWVESFGRVIIEAMAVGVPVILPYEYKELFGEAAIYAFPSEVQKKVELLIADEKKYQEQIEIANDYVEKHFGYTKHGQRLAKYTKI
ncbi:glycosyltransferase [Evansella cellulosilytica]|uniref:Glycosyl transferase family 2 n=1 Tax=Evansella cellulosilytica (strain ATCC 21833 / DSM 2522 / FERM P-1141 / JCM 9156 / N-4) TaxID=649639 RepID=E6TSB8_EVAC2|nr:glycosyltransferase [Evansella cellulosilytica]ADU31887.1 glycosyl transferase family 2 [Evansella cellulosilytica DSM 2522]